MFKTLIAAAALATGLGMSSALAAPFATTFAPVAPLGAAADANVVEAHFTGDGHHIGGRRHYRPRHYRGHRRHYRPRTGFSVELQFGQPRYQKRHRGGYRATYGGRHHAWCAGKYRSYHRSSGTYQPYHGPRRRCNSPYDGI